MTGVNRREAEDKTVEALHTAPRNLFLSLLKLHLGGVRTLASLIEKKNSLRRKAIFSEGEGRVDEKKVKTWGELLSPVKWGKFSLKDF